MSSDPCDSMVSRIKLLDESTINKIAAGEVIERPASVVKELTENSIDANASDVRVEIRGYGTKSILVVDDGIGMSHIDASIAFKKHATSKINSIEDLDKILTMGFRGEALSSISSVSRVELVTRQKGELEGTKVVVESNGIENISPVGTAVGTSVIVNDLFYSTPARKKYLKSARTEISHIVDVVSRNCLAHPDVSFTLIIDGKAIIRSPSSVGLLDSIVHLYGADIARSLVPVEYESDLISIYGYISKPELTRSGKDMQLLSINKRPISSSQLSNAIRLGYYTLLPKGRYPAAFLNFVIDPFNVDVNVHPAKREVRISHERDIEAIVTSAIEHALEKQSLIPQADVKKKNTNSQVHLTGKELVKVYKSNDTTADHVNKVPVTKDEITGDSFSSEDQYTASILADVAINENKASYHYSAKDTQRRLKKSERMQMSVVPDEKVSLSGPFNTCSINVYGQYAELYILCELDGQLILLDQHAAHERIMYEQLLKQQDRGWQELITPVTLDLSQKDKAIIEEFIPQLEKLGFSVSEFGARSYVVTTVPSIFGKLENTDVIYDIISDLFSVGKLKGDTEIYENLCSSMACRASIKAGNVCSLQQMEELVHQLVKCRNPYTCPHGRPTMLTFSREELAKMFKRT